MNELVPTFTDISDWYINVYQSTGGTRSKNIAIHPETSEQFFFKGSKETATGEIRYPKEFWSEIVASKVGTSLGFNMLDYNIAYDNKHKQKIGCLSKSMIVPGNNKLTEGVTYLSGFDSKYRPDISEHKIRYTFQFICDALDYFALEKYIEKIIETIIFDSIIGNSDRHQENWGIITNFERGRKNMLQAVSRSRSRFASWFDNSRRDFVANLIKAKERNQHPLKTTDLILEAGILPNNFAPIYDSGCCLGREMGNEKILKMLKDDQMIEAYIRKGQAEIHWEDAKKRNHFELVKLIKTKHADFVLSIIRRTKERYKPDMIIDIITNIDQNLPIGLSECKLEDHRKDLMVKLITLRLQSLFNIL